MTTSRSKPASSERPTPDDDVKKLDVRVLLLNCLALLAFAVAVAALFPTVGLADQAGLLDTILLLTLTVTTLVATAQQLPWQNVLLAAAGIAVIGGGAHAAGVKTALPFGPFIFGENAGDKMFYTLPWMVPFLWIIIVLNARGVARLILRPWRKAKTYGFRLLGATAVLTALFDVAFDPFATHTKHFWIWTSTKLPLTWLGAPLVNFLAWGAVAALMLGFTTPALIRKQPGQKSGPDYHPLVVWLAAMLLFGTAAALNNLWPAVAVDAVIGIAVASFAISGARW
jgi:uncharacterized membrane protein